MDFIKNKRKLLSHGHVELRQDMIDIIEFALSKADPYEKVKELIHVDDDTMIVGNNKFDLSQLGNIYILGAGKATYPIAKGLEEILGQRIKEGVVICKKDQNGTLDYCRMRFGGHPIPDESGYAAAKEIMEIVQKIKPKDVVFSISTGGATSMMPYPVDGVTLEEKMKTGELLLQSGASMWEMNYVRSHITQLKAGLMGKLINPEAIIINLGVADGIGQTVDDCVDTTTACFSSFDDAGKVLTKYDLWRKIPQSVSDYIKSGNEKNEIPRDLNDHIIYNYLLVEVNDAVDAALERAGQLGYHSMILTTYYEGDSRALGELAGSIALEELHNSRPLPKPAAIIIGGESMQIMNGKKPGVGGPSQQFVLSCAVKIKEEKNIVICGLDTDGSDGPTSFAGGIIDYSTYENSLKKGIDIYDYMDRFDDTKALDALNDAILTGATGTNVNDLRIIIVSD